jgi:hypothetical protein
MVTIAIDVSPLDCDKARAVGVPFLGRQVELLPGVVALAQHTGAPVLMSFVYRSADYRHQVLEISAPVPVAGDPAAAFERCVAGVSAAIRRAPSHWAYWASTDDLVQVGLIPAEQDKAPAAVSPATTRYRRRSRPATTR